MAADLLAAAAGASVSVSRTVPPAPDLATIAAWAGIIGALAAVIAIPVAIWQKLGRTKDDGDDSAPDADARARSQLLEEVRRHWVDTELDGSLHNLARMELGLATRPAAVGNPFRAVVRHPPEPDEPLPKGTRVADVYRRLGKQLLILGEPGSGKTTLLLQLTAELLEEVAATGSGLLPVVFHLSTWRGGRGGLSTWLVDELNTRYGVGRRLGQRWVQSDLVIPLLDGLDEIASERRASCLVAINEFHAQHGLLPLVVASRTEEYEALRSKLALRGAIVIRPLTREQVDEYVADAGPALDGIRRALAIDEGLYELLTTPLFLSIAALTYRDRPTAAHALGSVHDRRRQLFTDFVEAMLRRPSTSLRRFPDDRTTAWLSWLARSMQEHDQSVFYPDLIQPDWLPRRLEQWTVTIGVTAAVSLLCGSLAGLVVGLASYPMVGLIFGLGTGLGVALCSYDPGIAPAEQLRWSWLALLRELPRWLALFGFAFGLGGGAGVAVAVLVHGTTFGVLNHIDQGIAGSMATTLGPVFTNIAAGVGVGVGIGLVGGLGSGLETRFSVTPPAVGAGIRRSRWTALIGGVTSGTISALFVLVAVAVLPDVYARTIVPYLVRVNPDIVDSLYTGLVFGLGGGLVAALTIRTVPRLGAAFPSGLTAAVVGGLVLGVVFQSNPFFNELGSVGLGGLGPRLPFALGFGLVVALGGGVGGDLARRVVVGVGGGLIVALVGSLVLLPLELAPVVGPTGGVHYELPLMAAPIQTVAADAAAVGLAVGFAVALQRGGGAYLRHRSLRAMLVLDGVAPADLVGLLEYGARLVLLRQRGGGFQFVHRYLLEHFAGGARTPGRAMPVMEAPGDRARPAVIGAVLAGATGALVVAIAAAMLVTDGPYGPFDDRTLKLVTAAILYLPFAVACIGVWALARRRIPGRGRLVARTGASTGLASMALVTALLAGVFVTLARVGPVRPVEVDLSADQAFPTMGGVTQAADGAVWFTEPTANRIGRRGPDGAISEFLLPTASAGPLGIALGGDGNLWFAEYGARRIGRITPAGVITEYRPLRAGNAPVAIASAPDGGLWFTASPGELARITPGGAIVDTPIAEVSQLEDLEVDGAGAAWAVDRSGSGIVRVMPDGRSSHVMLRPQRAVGAVAVGRDGTVWFTEGFTAGGTFTIGRISPGGPVTDLTLAHAPAFPGRIAAGPNGSAWFIEDTGHIGRISPSGTVTEFQQVGDPVGLFAGRDDDLWFTELSNRGTGLGHVAPDGAIQESPVSTGIRGPQELAASPDGSVWFTDSFDDRVGRVSRSGVIVEFELPHPDSDPFTVAVAADGDAWFTEQDRGAIGRITPAGRVAEFPLPGPGAMPESIALGAGGRFWFSEVDPGRIGWITPDGGGIGVVPVPGTPYRIAATPDGGVWYSDYARDRIGRVTAAGRVTEYALHDAAGGPYSMTATTDGSAWFTEPLTNRIGRITPAGAITEFPISALLGVSARGFGTLLNVGPRDIAVGPDGDLWFTESVANRIGRITPAGAVRELQLPRPTAALTFAVDGRLWYTSRDDGHLSSLDPATL